MAKKNRKLQIPTWPAFVACVGCKTGEVPPLVPICDTCHGRLPEDVRTEVDLAHAGGSVSNRLATQSRVRAALLTLPA